MITSASVLKTVIYCLHGKSNNLRETNLWCLYLIGMPRITLAENFFDVSLNMVANNYSFTPRLVTKRQSMYYL